VTALPPAEGSGGGAHTGAFSGPQVLIDSGAAELRQAGVEEPRREAELLLAHTLGVSRPQLVAGLAGDSVEPERVDAYFATVSRRATREPFAYVVGRKGFRRIDLMVDRRVLIPRPETELLAAVAIAAQPRTVLDVATGSGAVALALAQELPEIEVDAVDISEDALEVARANAEHLGLDDRTRFWRSDLLAEVEGSYDCIVANLPYVPSGELAGLQPEIVRYEPVTALDGGPDGLDVVRRLVSQTPGHLNAGGQLALEIGHGQGDATSALLHDAGFADVCVHRDLTDKERVVSGTWR
jgi:release factor glutamine methyltransferase